MKLFVITIDTEADCSSDWTGAVPESYNNLPMLRERLLPVLERYGAVATLLLNGDIIDRDGPSRICEEVSRDAGWELGTHLHGEYVEPERKFASPAGILLRDFQCGYPPNLELAKMQTLTEMFVHRFGRKPTSFRAGRFGAGRTTFESCLRLGYEVETSVVPGAFLREGPATADFRSYGIEPCIVARNGERSVIEIPVTVKPGWLPSASQLLMSSFSGISCNAHGVRKLIARLGNGVDRLSRPLHRSLWLRPSYSSAREMEQVLAWLAERKLPSPLVANMMFHSNELKAGGSPYNASESDVSAFLERLSSSLGYAVRAGWRFTTLTEASRQLRVNIQ